MYVVFLCKSEEEVERALLNDDPYDQLSIAYHLILDSKRRQENCKYFYD